MDDILDNHILKLLQLKRPPCHNARWIRKGILTELAPQNQPLEICGVSSTRSKAIANREDLILRKRMLQRSFTRKAADRKLARCYVAKLNNHVTRFGI
jgi:hypothetical protein